MLENGFLINVDDLRIQGTLLEEGKYSYSVSFSDASEVYVDLEGVYCLDGG